MRAIKLITLPIINNLFVYEVYKKVLYVMVESWFFWVLISATSLPINAEVWYLIPNFFPRGSKYWNSIILYSLLATWDSGFSFAQLVFFSWRKEALSKPWHFLVFYISFQISCLHSSQPIYFIQSLSAKIN